MRLSRLFGVCATVAVLVAAACDDDTVDQAGDRTTSASGGSALAAIDNNRRPPAGSVPGARPGGTITVLDAGGPVPTMDPTEAFYPITSSILSGLVTRSLTQYAFDPGTGSMTLIPDIATTIGTPNEDFTEWTFTIRKGVRFEDGTEVTAADVAYGIERSFDRKAFPDGAAYSNDYFWHGDSYHGPYRSGTDYDGVVVDGDRLTVKMARPFPEMPYWGTFPAMGPIPRSGSDPKTYGLHPLSTGPYMFEGDAAGSGFTLVRNPHWDAATDAGRHQYVDRFRFRFTDSPLRRIDAAILDDKDGATMLTTGNVLTENYRSAAKRDLLTVGSAPCTHMWRPDFRDPTTADLAVRRAIGYAFPYREVAAALGESFGVTYLPGSVVLPPGTPGRAEVAALDASPGETDPAKARDLLAEAGYAPGEAELRWYYLTDALSVAEKNIIVRALERAGFKASPRPVRSFEEFLAVSEDPHAPINVRTWVAAGWCLDWPSGSGALPQLFGARGVQNVGYFSADVVDAEIERIRALPLDEQLMAWGQLDKRIATEYYPAIVTDYRGVAMLHGSSIGGMNDDATCGEPTWKDLYVVR